MAADERLDAGRHHLDNGIRALRQGFLDESRSHFEAALIQFRGPELRLGEAHALRGLAEVELHGGNVQMAEQAVRGAIVQYAEVRNQLDRIDPHQISHELRRDAEEGEAAAHVLLGEILLRVGRAEEARSMLAYGQELFGGLGDVPSAAGAPLAMARLCMRESRWDDARSEVRKSVDILARCGDTAGQCGAWLLAAEVARLAGDLEEAERVLGNATRLADETRQPALMGRSRSQQAGLLAQRGRLNEALSTYDESLKRIREAGEAELEAFALLGRGDVRSRLDDHTALLDLVEGARLLAQLDHRHGLGAALLRLAEHAVRIGLPAWGLAASEGARQAWQVTDPRRGVGQVLRIQIKALAGLKKWPAVVTVAHARAALVGDTQPNAVEVREFYRDRAPVGLLTELDLMDAEQLQLRGESMVEALLSPLVTELDLDFQALGTPGGAMAVINALARSTPPPAMQRASRPSAPPEPEEAEAAPPEEPRNASAYDDLYAPPAPFAADDEESGDADDLDATTEHGAKDDGA
ncbi:MAG: hypothetical protein KC621_25205 [Myxococcales bacterium]|nr:hypothetical protein [Myxococcales bacterium]